MTRRIAGVAQWLTVGILTASACEPALLEQDDVLSEEGVRTAQTARPPTLTKVEPAAIIAGSEGELTITGKGFVPGLRVMVGGLLAPTPRTVTSTKIQVALPPGLSTSAAVAVRVTLPDGRQGERSDLFAVTADPIALSLAPPRQRYDVAGARAPVVADFNLDGRPDLAAVTSTGSGVVLHLSSPSGGALTAQAGPTFAGAYTMSAADLNRDSKPDLIVTSRSGSPAVTVFLGNGDGSFQPSRPVTAFTSSFSDYQNNHVVAGDVTADGKVDLLVGDIGGDVYLFAGVGDGTYLAGTSLGKTSQPVRAIRLADLDGNGALDVVAASGMVSGGGGTILGFVRQMDGTFKNTHTLASMESFSALSLLDYDADGKTDAAAVAASGKLYTFRGNGDGTFGAGVSSDIGKNGAFLTAGDLNADGKPDLASGGRFENFSSPTAPTFISLLNADGTTKSSQLEADGLYSGGVLADMNKDGRLDLVVSHTERNELSVIFGRGDGSFVLNGPTGTVTATSSGDFNGDGKLDLIYVGSSVDKLAIMLGRSDGSFGPPRTFDVDRAPSAVRSGDFDGDGKLDVAVTCYDTNLVSLLLGKGDGTFATQRTFSVGRGPNSLAVLDLDADGKLDIVTANVDADSVSVLIGNGTGNFAVNKDYATGKGPVSVAAADLSGDGRPDVVTANADANTVSYLQGSAVTAGALNVAKSLSVGQSPADVAVSDVTGDGKLDIVTVNSDSNNLAALVGRGDGTFVSSRYSPTCEFPTDFAAGELTGDGKVDLVVRCAAGKRSQALIGQGDGSFVSSPRAFPLGTAVLITDVNADSKSDLLFFDSGQPLQVLLNSRK
jgi:hypothetical protein